MSVRDFPGVAESDQRRTRSRAVGVACLLGASVLLLAWVIPILVVHATFALEVGMFGFYVVCGGGVVTELGGLWSVARLLGQVGIARPIVVTLLGLCPAAGFFGVFAAFAPEGSAVPLLRVFWALSTSGAAGFGATARFSRRPDGLLALTGVAVVLFVIAMVVDLG